jgi:hypothetical protein
MAGGGGVPGWGTASQCARTPWQRPGRERREDGGDDECAFPLCF